MVSGIMEILSFVLRDSFLRGMSLRIPMEEGLRLFAGGM